MMRKTLLPLALLLPLVGCDQGQPLPEENDVYEAFETPRPDRVEILFVIDDGPTMCDEQDSLNRNFQAWANFAFEEMLPYAQVRMAVVRADLATGTPGALVVDPAAPVAVEGCAADGMPHVPNTDDCAALIAEGGLPSVIGLGPGLPAPAACADVADPTVAAQCAKDHIERQFRCLSTLGVGGDAPPQGLEAMRRALDCNGPNRALFESCCVDIGDPERGLVYNPACVPDPEAEPTFLHPDASLFVVFLSDRDDCSGGGADCAAEDLTPVEDYYRFLTSLKARPLGQLWVSAVVGAPAFTPDGWPITWSDAPPLEGCAPGDTDDRCCPDGVCRGTEVPSCVSERGEAYDGRRYRALAGQFDEELACIAPTGLPPTSSRVEACDGQAAGASCQWADERDAVSAGVCLPPGDGAAAACSGCVTICEDDFADAIAGPWRGFSPRTSSQYCMLTEPACRVADDGGRPCATDAERAAPENREVQVRFVCPPHNAAYCEGLDVTLGRDDWRLDLDGYACFDRPLITLFVTPPPGAQIELRYLPEG